MKKILICAILLNFIALLADGQHSPDTLYLKNGYKTVGTLLEKSMTEYRFKSTDGIVFTFSPGEVEKVVTAKGPVIYPAVDSLAQANKIINHSKGQSMLFLSPTVLINTPNGVQFAGGIKYQLFLGNRVSLDADFVFGKDYFHLGTGLIGLPIGLLAIEAEDDEWWFFLFGLAAMALSFEHISYHIPVTSDLDISPYVSVFRYKYSYEFNNYSDTTFISQQFSFATGVQVNRYIGKFVFSPYCEYNVGYKDLGSRFNVGVYLGIYFARPIL
jgi:hypothetical protein